MVQLAFIQITFIRTETHYIANRITICFHNVVIEHSADVIASGATRAYRWRCVFAPLDG